jgi:myo-inositol 2-dehydrogenase / D-chiro-inositol 1-dehydrogenase
MKPIRIALFGMGRIGKIHFKNIMQHIPNAIVGAVADPYYDPQVFRQEYGDVFFTQSAEQALARPDIDAIMICTPTSSHASLLQAAAAAGKPVFCEKPMDLSLERTLELAELIQESDIRLMLGFNRRFDPDFLHAKQLVEEKRIGGVQVVKITSRDPGLPSIDYIKNSGGLFMDMAIHDFDMARYIMGKEVVEVYARGLVLIDPAVGDAGDIDTALTTLTFDDGTYAVIDNSRKASYGYDQRIEIFGDNGMIQVDNNYHHTNVIYDNTGIHHALPLDFFMDRYSKSYLKEVELFVDALVNDKPMPVTERDGLEATLIAKAAKVSMQEERPVKLSEMRTKVVEAV